MKRNYLKRIELFGLIGILVALLLIFGSVAYSQEATETPVPDPVVVTEPVETAPNALDAIQTFFLGAIAVLGFLVTRLLPKLLEIIQLVRDEQKKTNAQITPRQ